MGNFAQVLTLAIRNRLTLLRIGATAILSAILCCANFSMVYPTVEIVCRGKSISQWLEDKATIQEQELRKTIAQLNESPTNELRPPLENSAQAARDRLGLYEYWLAKSKAYLPSSAFGTLLMMASALLIGTILKGFVDVANARFVARIVEQAIMDLRTQLFECLLKQTPGDQRHSRGDCMNRFVNDLSRLHSELHFVFGRFLKEPIVILGCLIAAAIVAWRLVFVALLVVPISVWLMYKLAHRLRRAHHTTADCLSHVVDHLTEATSALAVVQAFGMEAYEAKRFKQTATLYAKASEKAAMLVAAIGPAFDALGMLGYATVILLGGYLVLENQTHVGILRLSNHPMQLSELLLIVGLLGGIYNPARRLLGMFGRLQAAATASDRVFELLQQPKTKPILEPLSLVHHRSEIRFEDLWFGYSKEKPILKGLDLRVPFGSIVALVGLNGSGKSTLMDILTRFRDQDSGRILLDGVDIRQFDVNEYRSHIGLVPQHTLLLKESIAENIRYGDPRASLEDITLAAKQAHIHDRIAQLEAGYNTLAGTDGHRLSGGERQRIALARALVRKPEILILDEVTSHIDYESEQIICQALLAARGTRTTLLITHRVSTLALADMVAVLAEGRIVSSGDHPTLLRTCDFYRHLMEHNLANTLSKAA